MSTVEDRQIGAPGSDLVAVLLRHDARRLREMPEVVHHPRREQLGERDPSQGRMLPLERQLARRQSPAAQSREVLRAQRLELIEQVAHALAQALVRLCESIEWVESEKLRSADQYALCRCGASNTKPFCDGTHLKIGFDGTETASREPVLNQAELLDGPTMQLADAVQRSLVGAWSMTLCRCGRSENKPFCNGSHAA